MKADGRGRNDMYAPDSIELLKKSGIDFKRHEDDGINVETFGELMITSGMVLFKDVKWVSFHSSVCSFEPPLPLTLPTQRLRFRLPDQSPHVRAPAGSRV